MSPFCVRCGDAIDSDVHTIWQCPYNDLINSDFIRESDRYKGRAFSESDTEPCLWLRGILPSNKATISKEDIALRRFFASKVILLPSGHGPQEFITGMAAVVSTVSSLRRADAALDLHI